MRIYLLLLIIVAVCVISIQSVTALTNYVPNGHFDTDLSGGWWKYGGYSFYWCSGKMCTGGYNSWAYSPVFPIVGNKLSFDVQLLSGDGTAEYCRLSISGGAGLWSSPQDGCYGHIDINTSSWIGQNVYLDYYYRYGIIAVDNVEHCTNDVCNALIIDWNNTYTSNNNTAINITQTTVIAFSATTNSVASDSWNWTVDGFSQSNNSYEFSYLYNYIQPLNGTIGDNHTITVKYRNETENSNTISWLLTSIDCTPFCIIPDTTPPVITVLGENPVLITQGDTYIDAGATAWDDIDGDITDNIITVNPVDINTAGTYIITYNVVDAASNPAIQQTRTIIVEQPQERRQGSGGGDSGDGGDGQIQPLIIEPLITPPLIILPPIVYPPIIIPALPPILDEILEPIVEPIEDIIEDVLHLKLEAKQVPAGIEKRTSLNRAMKWLIIIGIIIGLVYIRQLINFSPKTSKPKRFAR